MKRPDRKNYPNGVFGDVSYNERLERYCSYLENQNKRLLIADVVERSEQLKAEGRKEATKEIRQWLIEMDYEGLAERL